MDEYEALRDEYFYWEWYDRELQCADEESLDQLMEELENEVVGEEEPDEWSVWLEAGWRSIPNRG